MEYLKSLALQEKAAKAAKEAQEASDRVVETDEVTSLIIKDIFVKARRIFFSVTK